MEKKLQRMSAPHTKIKPCGSTPIAEACKRHIWLAGELDEQHYWQLSIAKQYTETESLCHCLPLKLDPAQTSLTHGLHSHTFLHPLGRQLSYGCSSAHGTKRQEGWPTKKKLLAPLQACRELSCLISASHTLVERIRVDSIIKKNNIRHLQGRNLKTQPTCQF